MSVAYLFWKLSSYIIYIVCTTCPSSRSDADLFENCKVVYGSRCHKTYSPDSILLSIAFGTENPILYCCNYIPKALKNLNALLLGLNHEIPKGQ